MLEISRAKDSKNCFNTEKSTKTRCVVGGGPDPSLNETLWLTYPAQQFIEASGHHWFSKTKSTDQHLLSSSSHSLEAWLPKPLRIQDIKITIIYPFDKTNITICQLSSVSNGFCGRHRAWLPCPAVPRRPNEPGSFPPPAVQHPEPFEWPAMGLSFRRKQWQK